MVEEPIQQYIQLLSTSGAATPDASYIRTIVLKALTDPSVYVGFQELQSLPVVKTLAESSTNKSLYDTLTLFSFGVYRDYVTAENGMYVPLTDAQVLKLKALTVVSTIHNHCKGGNVSASPNSAVGGSNALAVNSRRGRRRSKATNTNNNSNVTTQVAKAGMVPYATLQKELGYDSGDDTDNVRQLEELLIHCIYANLLPPGTKLNQQNRSLDIQLSNSTAASTSTSHILCRDVHLENDLPGMIEELEEFYQHGLQFKTSLQQGIRKWKEDAYNETQSWKNVEAEMKSVDDKLGVDIGIGSSMFSGGLGNIISASLDEVTNWGPAGAEDASATRQVKRSRAGNSALHGAKKGFLKFGNK